jgi:hypothetical protein
VRVTGGWQQPVTITSGFGKSTVLAANPTSIVMGIIGGHLDITSAWWRHQARPWWTRASRVVQAKKYRSPGQARRLIPLRRADRTQGRTSSTWRCIVKPNPCPSNGHYRRPPNGPARYPSVDGTEVASRRPRSRDKGALESAEHLWHSRPALVSAPMRCVFARCRRQGRGVPRP